MIWPRQPRLTSRISRLIMSRTALTLLAVLLTCAPFSAADPIPILAGLGTLHGFQEAPPRYEFSLLVATGSDFTVETLGDFTANSGLVQCMPCDPRNFGLAFLLT